MKSMRVIAVIAMCVMAALFILTGCTQGGSQPSAASSSAASGASSASASAAASSTAATSSASSASAGAEASSAASASKAAPSAPAVADGKQLVVGTVACTTFKDRAAETGFPGSDFANNDTLLTLLVLESPIEVTAYKGGGAYTGEVSVIRLPDDEMFRQFKDQKITIGVDSWGEFPADITAMLYDLVLAFDDGLTLVDPA